MVRAVFDAHVFISALVNPRGVPGCLFTAFLAESQPCDLVTSPAILTEVQAVLHYPRLRRFVGGAEEATARLLDVASLTDLVNDTNGAAGVCRDPSDDKYLSAAVEGRADYLVSGDRDLLDLGQHDLIAIVTPKSFLAMVSP